MNGHGVDDPSGLQEATKNTKAAGKVTKAEKAAAPAPKAERTPPPVGTVLTKKLRSGKVIECHVTKEGYRIGKETFDSISAAATHAAGTPANGWVWFGIEARPSTVNPKEAFDAAATRLLARAEALKGDPQGRAVIGTFAARLSRMAANG